MGSPLTAAGRWRCSFCRSRRSLFGLTRYSYYLILWFVETDIKNLLTGSFDKASLISCTNSVVFMILRGMMIQDRFEIKSFWNQRNAPIEKAESQFKNQKTNMMWEINKRRTRKNLWCIREQESLMYKGDRQSLPGPMRNARPDKTRKAPPKNITNWPIQSTSKHPLTK